jgi:hypothetical protein
MAQDRIERLHLLDLDIAYEEGEDLVRVCDDLTIGLLVQHSVLIPVDQMNAVGNQWPVIRFTGPRNQLEELLNRYDGVTGVFDPSHNPNWPPA